MIMKYEKTVPLFIHPGRELTAIFADVINEDRASNFQASTNVGRVAKC